MRPPVSDYGTLEFGSFQVIYDIGYDYAKSFLNDAEKSGLLENVPLGPERNKMRKPQRRNSRPASLHPERRNSL